MLAKSIDGAKSYIWQYAKHSQPLNGEGWIITGYCTKSQLKISEFDVAGKYWLRVAGITSGGATNYCSAIMKVVE